MYRLRPQPPYDLEAGRSRLLVDTRPLGMILLERSLRSALLIGTALLYCFVVTRPLPEGLSEAGLKSLGA